MLAPFLFFASLSRPGKLIVRLLRDGRVPGLSKLIALAAIVYVISPIDLRPDYIPAVGWIDDLIVMGVGVGQLLLLSPRLVLGEHLAATGLGSSIGTDSQSSRKPADKVVEGSVRYVDEEEESDDSK